MKSFIDRTALDVSKKEMQRVLTAYSPFVATYHAEGFPTLAGLDELHNMTVQTWERCEDQIREKLLKRVSVPAGVDPQAYKGILAMPGDLDKVKRAFQYLSQSRKTHKTSPIGYEGILEIKDGKLVATETAYSDLIERHTDAISKEHQEVFEAAQKVADAMTEFAQLVPWAKGPVFHRQLWTLIFPNKAEGGYGVESAASKRGISIDVERLAKYLKSGKKEY